MGDIFCDLNEAQTVAIDDERDATPSDRTHRSNIAHLRNRRSTHFLERSIQAAPRAVGSPRAWARCNCQHALTRFDAEAPRLQREMVNTLHSRRSVALSRSAKTFRQGKAGAIAPTPKSHRSQCAFGHPNPQPGDDIGHGRRNDLLLA